MAKHILMNLFTCNWGRIEKYHGVEQVMSTILQKHLAQKLSTQLNLGKSLMETEGTCCGISQQSFVVHVVARPKRKLAIDT
jgi:hypothetical protein